MELAIQGLDGSMLGHLRLLPWAPLVLLAWALAALAVTRLADGLAARALASVGRRRKAKASEHCAERLCDPERTPVAGQGAEKEAAEAGTPPRPGRERWADMQGDSEEEPTWACPSAAGEAEAAATSSRGRRTRCEGPLAVRSVLEQHCRPARDERSSAGGARRRQRPEAAWRPPRPAPPRDRRPEAPGAGAGGRRVQCQFFIDIEEDRSFQVVHRLLGPRGSHMKFVAEESGAKLRLRGRGSRFLEGPEQQESSDPLMLCVSAPDRASYAKAVRLVRDLLEDIYADYRSFCVKAGRTSPALKVNVHEGSRRRTGGPSAVASDHDLSNKQRADTHEVSPSAPKAMRPKTPPR